MVLSHGHRKQLGMALDLLKHKNSRTAAASSSMNTLLRGGLVITGTMRTSSKNRVSLLESKWHKRNLHHHENHPNPIQYYVNPEDIAKRSLKWVITYDFGRGTTKYIVTEMKRKSLYTSDGYSKKVMLMTKEEILRLFDNKLLVEVEAHSAGIHTDGEWFGPEIDIYSKHIKTMRQSHADLQKRQALLANVLHAVGTRRERERRGKSVMRHMDFIPGSLGYMEAIRDAKKRAGSNSPRPNNGHAKRARTTSPSAARTTSR